VTRRTPAVSESVVVDTGPLIALGTCGLAHLLTALHDRVNERVRARYSLPPPRGLQRLIDCLLQRIVLVVVVPSAPIRNVAGTPVT